MTQPLLFQVRNKHVADSGQPPHIDANTPRRYYSYFENAQGEQLIFIYDYEANASTLYHGDLGWEHPCPVEDGKCRSIIMDEAEQLWLRACWLAATALLKYRQ